MMTLFEYAYQEEKRRMAEEKQSLSVEIYEKRIGMLKWNFEELNRNLDIRLAKYKGLQYTDDQITEAKKDRANLNAFKKAINDRKIELKKEFCGPYDEFAAQVKQLTGKIDEASAGIDAQVKAFENKQKEEKLAEITEFWKTYGPEKADNIQLEKVFDQRWLNKSCKASTWQAELAVIAHRIDGDLAAIGNLDDVEKMNFCISEYFNSLDLGRALAAWEEKKEQDRRDAEFRERMMRERELREAARKAEEEKRQKAAEEVRDEDPVLYTRAFKVQGTREQIIALGEFMKQNGIAFWKIELQ